MSGNGNNQSRLAELTAEYRGNKKPITLSVRESKLADLIKEGKNKFRKKYKFVVYCCTKSGDGRKDQYLCTDEDLRQVLRLHDGPAQRF